MLSPSVLKLEGLGAHGGADDEGETDMDTEEIERFASKAADALKDRLEAIVRAADALVWVRPDPEFGLPGVDETGRVRIGGAGRPTWLPPEMGGEQVGLHFEMVSTPVVESGPGWDESNGREESIRPIEDGHLLELTVATGCGSGPADGTVITNPMKGTFIHGGDFVDLEDLAAALCARSS